MLFVDVAMVIDDFKNQLMSQLIVQNYPDSPYFINREVHRVYSRKN